MVHSEELTTKQAFAVNADQGCRVRIPLYRPLRSKVEDFDGISRRMEVPLAFVGDDGLALKSPPMPYPAKYV
jgi:hypothetical protein